MTRRAGAYVAFGLLVLAACGPDEAPNVPAQQDGAVHGPVLTSGPADGDQGDSAEIYGTLVLDGDCLLLEQEGTRYAVIWPHGTSWQAEPPAVVLTTGVVVEIGGSVRGGGGYHGRSADRPSAFGDEIDDAISACIGTTGATAQFNPGSTVEGS